MRGRRWTVGGTVCCNRHLIYLIIQCFPDDTRLAKYEICSMVFLSLSLTPSTLLSLTYFRLVNYEYEKKSPSTTTTSRTAARTINDAELSLSVATIRQFALSFSLTAISLFCPFSLALFSRSFIFIISIFY